MNLIPGNLYSYYDSTPSQQGIYTKQFAVFLECTPDGFLTFLKQDGTILHDIPRWAGAYQLVPETSKQL